MISDEGSRKKDSKKKILLSLMVISIIAFIIISPQIYQKYIVLGYDISFHFNRFYDLYKQIETGHFNYFQTIYGFNSSGRIINALYGYDFAFLQACILFITKSWLKFQIVSSYLSLLVAGISMYTLAKKIGLKNNYATLSGIFYMTTASATYYMRFQAFTGWGAAFLPLIFIPAIRAVRNKEKPINPVFLSIPTAILLNVHILSAFIGVLAIVPFFLAGFLKTKKKLCMVRDGLIAVLITILLSINTLYSYYEVYSSNNILSPFLPDSIYLESFRFSLSGLSFQRSSNILLSLILIFAISFSLINWKKQDRLKKIIDFTGILFLIISSTLVPWDIIANKFPFIAGIQFPCRFSVVGFILLILSFLMSIETLIETKDKQKKSVVLALVMTIATLSVVSIHNTMVDNAEKWLESPTTMISGDKSAVKVRTDDEIRNNFRSKDLTKALKTISKGTSDYLPIPEGYSSVEAFDEFQPYKTYKDEILENKLNIKKEVLSDGRIAITWQQKTEKLVTLPIIIYEHSTIDFNGKIMEPKNVATSNIGSLKLKASSGKNKVIVGYESKFDMAIILLVKLVALLSVFLYLILKFLKRL